MKPYTTEWYCIAPRVGDRFVVVSDEWTYNDDGKPVRRIYAWQYPIGGLGLYQCGSYDLRVAMQKW